MEWFTRRHAVILARSSLSRLKYLEKTGIVVPWRRTESQKSEVLYSWDQILEIRAIARLRQYLSFQAIRKIIQYFEDHGFERSLRDKQLIVKDGNVTWVRPSKNLSPQIIQLRGRRDSHLGQLVLSALDGKETADRDAQYSALSSKIISFEDFKQKLKSPR
jgi:DNA-binding transcriptional MerR regulator